MTQFRPFAGSDYEPVAAIHNRIFANDPFGANEWRYWDSTWEHDLHFRERLTILDDAGAIAGWGELAHIPGQFDPTTYTLEVAIDHPYRRQGHGSAAYDRLLTTFAARGGRILRGWVKESEPAALKFVADRGFTERRREWQSRLDVTTFDPAPFAGAMERVTSTGIILTNLAAEQARNPHAAQDAYTLTEIIAQDVPDLEAHTPLSFEHFVKSTLEAPDAIAAAHLIARDGDRYVGLARMMGSEIDDTILYQSLTGVIPAYRGRGIAMALKLATVDCARSLGKREITTWNDTANRAMLRINEAMGFVKEPAEIVVVREFLPSSNPAPDAGALSA